MMPISYKKMSKQHLYVIQKRLSRIVFCLLA